MLRSIKPFSSSDKGNKVSVKGFAQDKLVAVVNYQVDAIVVLPEKEASAWSTNACINCGSRKEFAGSTRAHRDKTECVTRLRKDGSRCVENHWRAINDAQTGATLRLCVFRERK
ncbi:MAG: hypothetical protein CR997_10200 [Acidobacteria bacterium]|nr:MAG: hypothetical protein CR997_10200 [Acidobacteriota bacterium]